MVALDGEPISRATIEHISPRTAGGTDALENLGLACAAATRARTATTLTSTATPAPASWCDRLLQKRRASLARLMPADSRSGQLRTVATLYRAA